MILLQKFSQIFSNMKFLENSKFQKYLQKFVNKISFVFSRNFMQFFLFYIFRNRYSSKFFQNFYDTKNNIDWSLFFIQNIVFCFFFFLNLQVVLQKFYVTQPFSTYVALKLVHMLLKVFRAHKQTCIAIGYKIAWWWET